jgi:peptide/nickel transport system permease protein
MRYVTRRLLHAALVLWGVSVLTFLFWQLAPGDYLSEIRMIPQVSPETIDALRVQYGLDRPLPVRYLRWLKSVAHGDLGFSFAYNMPASSLLFPRARNTLLLTTTAALLSWLIAVPLGIWAATHRDWLARLAFGIGTALLLALPEILLALGLVMLAVRTRMFPGGGMMSLDFGELPLLGKIKDLARHLALPVLAVVFSTLPPLLRHVRSAVVEVLDSGFMRAARGHGLLGRQIWFRYALPAAANPLIPLLGLSFATLLSSSLLVEVVMSWPGLGPMLLEAILARDLYIVIGAVMFSALFLIAGNLLADLLLYAADPRIRTEQP